MKDIKKMLKKTFKTVKGDAVLSLISLALITAFILGSFLIGITKSFFIVAIIAFITFTALYRRKKWFQKYGHDPIKRKKRRKITNIILIICLIFAILAVIAIGFFCFYIVKSAPEFSEKKLYTQDTSIVYDSEGNIIAKLGSEKRQKITFDELPQVLIDAVIATEDSRFFQHNGFDLPRFTKATLGQLAGNANAGGGSTITMQVVKNTLTSTDQNIIRKFTDIYLAVFVLEKKYTKEEIFELYVNIPFLGSNSYGVEEASQTYFGKHVNELNLSEAALLAGLFQSPSAYNPYNHPELAEKRRATVLYLMRLHGYITEEEEALANSISVEDLLVTDGTTTEGTTSSNPYQAYVDMVVEEVQDKTGKSPYDVPMEIYTTMSKTKQEALNKAVASVTFKDDYVQTGIAVTNVKTGAIVAIYGGRNKSGERTYNYATDIQRQIGSTAKPIYDYGPAVEYLDYNELTPFVDEKWTYSDGVSIQNWDGKYMGKLTLKQALGLSRNIPALKTFQTVGYKKSLAFALKLGMSPEVSSDGVIYETHAVGAYIGENPVTMAAAYAAFGNGGYYIEPYSITKIVYKDTSKEKEYKTTKTQAMSDSTAFIITDCLEWSVNSGLGSNAKVSGVEVAGKSGTTNFDDETLAKYKLPNSAINDLWMVAYSPSYSVAIWYGYDEISKEHYNTAGSNRLLIKAVMPAVITEKGDKFTVPSSVTKVTVEKDSNPIALPSEWTPSTMKTTAWFKVGSEPTEISAKYSPLNNVSSLNSSTDKTTVTLTWDHTISSALSAYLTKNAETLGEIGYNVYKKSSTGTLTLLGFTTDKTYTVKNISSSTTFIIKSTYSKAQTTESSGTSITVTPATFTLTLNPPVNKTITKGSTFIDNNPVTVEDLDGNALVEGTDYTKVEVLKDSSGNTVDLDEFTDTIGEYTLKYTVTYKGSSQSVTRTIQVTS